MTYQTIENSIDDGQPFYLYTFSNNTGSYLVTNQSFFVTDSAQTYEPLTIKHSQIKQSHDVSQDAVTVDIGIDGGVLADLFLGWSLDSTMSLTIKRGHFDSVQPAIVIWKGRVVSHKITKNILKLRCESIFTTLKRSGLRQKYQRSCRHQLYGNGCFVDKTLFEINNLGVTEINKTTLIIPDAALQVDGYFNGGKIVFTDGSERMIIGHIGANVTVDRSLSRSILSGIVPNSIIGAGFGNGFGYYFGGLEVTMFPGCDKTLETCNTKFNNVLNNGGFKWIPARNPLDGKTSII